MTRDTVSRSPFLPIWVWLAPVAALVLLLRAVQAELPKPTNLIAWYSIVVIVGAAALTRVCRAQKQFDFFEPLHLVFALFLIFYPVRALLAVWMEDSWFDPTKVAIWKGLSAAILGFVCFATGYKFGPRRSAVHRRLWLDGSWNLRRADGLSLGFLLAGLAGIVGARVIGGSFFYFVLLDPDIKAPGEIKAWFFYLLWLCVLTQVGALIQFGVWLYTGRRPFRTALFCTLALLSTFLLARYFTVAFLILLVLGWHYQKRQMRVSQVFVLFFLVLGYLGIAGLYREWISPANGLEEAGELAELAGQQNRLAIRYVVNNLEELSNLSEVISMTPSELPYQFGSTFGSFFLKPIPRILLPAKPLGASALFTQQTSPNAYYSGLVTGLGAWGEWYLNFSWLGLILGMMITGALSSAAYKSMLAAKRFGRVMLYASFVIGLVTWVRSDFNGATTAYLYYFIPFIIAFAYINAAKTVTRQVAYP